ncbi:hypothetical protein F4818DRAFT_418553, partial [Hypoxylon cercidicola]
MAASIPVLRVFVRDIRDLVAFYLHSGSFRDALRSPRRKQRRESGHGVNHGYRVQVFRSLDYGESDKIALSWIDINRTQEVHISFDHRIDIDGMGLDAERVDSEIAP